MHPLAAALNFSAWQNFYVVIGSSAGALIGLQFVVIALVANTRRTGDEGAIHAFGTPTVVHFSVALIVSALMNVPWPAVWAEALALAFCGIGGIGNMFRALGHARRQSNYHAVLEDWIWYTGVPFALYASLTLSAAFLGGGHRGSLLAVAGTTLGLLLVGIRNAWDTVTHLVTTQAGRPATPSSTAETGTQAPP